MPVGMTIRARLVFLGRLLDLAGAAERMVEATCASTVDALLDQLEPELAAALRSPKVRIAVAGGLGGLDRTVSDGDEVAFLPPVSGG